MGKDCKGRFWVEREGWDGKDGGMGVEGRDGKYVIGREGLDDIGNLFSHCSYLALRKKILKLLA